MPWGERMLMGVIPLVGGPWKQSYKAALMAAAAMAAKARLLLATKVARVCVSGIRILKLPLYVGAVGFCVREAKVPHAVHNGHIPLLAAAIFGVVCLHGLRGLQDVAATLRQIGEDLVDEVTGPGVIRIWAAVIAVALHIIVIYWLAG